MTWGKMQDFPPLSPLSRNPLTLCSDGSLNAMPQTQFAKGFYLGWVLSNMRATSSGSSQQLWDPASWLVTRSKLTDSQSMSHRQVCNTLWGKGKHGNNAYLTPSSEPEMRQRGGQSRYHKTLHWKAQKLRVGERAFATKQNSVTETSCWEAVLF